MNEKKNRLIRVISASISSLMTAVVGVLYIISCIGIWRSGSSPFTRESVGDALMKLLIPSIAAIVLMIATAVLFILFPVKEKKKAVNDAKDEISEMAVAIAEKVVGRELNAADQASLVDHFIDELGGKL